jgi:WD40 repeat protein
MCLHRSSLAQSAALALALVVVLRCPAREPRVWKGHDKEIAAVRFSPDGKVVASSGLDGKVLLRAAADGKVLATPPGHEGGAHALAFSADGAVLASAGADGVVRLWEVKAGREARRLGGHKGPVAAVAFSPGDRLLASGGYDGLILLWDPQTGKEVGRLKGHPDRVTALAFSPDGKQLVSGGMTRLRLTFGRGNVLGTGQADTLRLWDVEKRSELRVLPARGSTVAFSADGKTVAAGGPVLTVWRDGRTSGPIGIVGKDGKTTIIGDADVVSLATTAGVVVHEIKEHGNAVALSADGKVLATGRGSARHRAGFGGMSPAFGTTDDRARLWDVASGKEVLRLPQEDATALAFSPDGKVLAAGSRAGAITLWDLEAERRHPTPDPLETVTPPPPGDRLLAQLDADFQALLKTEKHPEALRRANRLLNRTLRRPVYYLDALAILRKQRPRAGIPLLLRYVVEHAGTRPGVKFLPSYLDTLAILTGQDPRVPEPRGVFRDREVREAVQKLVEDWWRPNKEKISTDLGAMSRGQLEFVIARLLRQANRKARTRLQEYDPDVGGEPGLQRFTALIGVQYEWREAWCDEDFHAKMVPLLLAPAGYDTRTAGPPASEDHRLPYTAVPLLAALRKKGDAPSLHRIAADAAQNTAVRLACLLALDLAGERVPADTLLAILKGEAKLERRQVAILVLGRCRDRKATDHLVALLEDGDVHIRTAAITALEDARPAAAVPKLKRLLAGGDRKEAVRSILSLLGQIGTREAQGVLADFLTASLEKKEWSYNLLHALSAFEEATGQTWTEAGARPKEHYRAAAVKALEWWKKQKQ